MTATIDCKKRKEKKERKGNRKQSEMDFPILYFFPLFFETLILRKRHIYSDLKKKANIIISQISRKQDKYNPTSHTNKTTLLLKRKAKYTHMLVYNTSMYACVYNF